MAHLSAVPIRLNDGRKVNGLRVLELKAALETFRVPETEHAQSKAIKFVQLKNSISNFRASQGSRGALEDGRDPNFQGCLQTELQRIVRVLTGRLSPLPIQLPQAD